MESSETPVNIASRNTSPTNEENADVNESQPENPDRTLTITFLSNGGLSYETSGDVGMFHLWTASRLLQHVGDELYTQQKIAAMQAEQQRGIQVARSIPQDFRRKRH